VVTAKRASSALGHRAQIARARRFLRAHVGDRVSLGEVARAAGASMYHLARLYRALTGETVGQALTRQRIARAAEHLVETPARSISTIALDAGFRTPSSLTKAFRAALGVSPSQFRVATPAERRELARALDREPPDEPVFALSGPRLAHTADIEVVYIRERGPYSEISAPLAWAMLEVRIAPTPLATAPRIGASYDDPEAVSIDELRYDAAVIVGPGDATPAGTRRATWSGGRFAVFDYRGDYRFIANAFRRIFADHQLALRRAPCLERYHGELTELWVPHA
jgi:AraC-like DNA-binding protein/DNA gyrase inhibitor GyrI